MHRFKEGDIVSVHTTPAFYALHDPEEQFQTYSLPFREPNAPRKFKILWCTNIHTPSDYGLIGEESEGKYYILEAIPATTITYYAMEVMTKSATSLLDKLKESECHSNSK